MVSMQEQIIEHVKLHPLLYDLSHEDYKNCRKKDKIWDEIGKSMDIQGDDLKKKWKNLRDAYAKHVRSEKTRTGDKAKTLDKYKTWPWAQQMSFFKPFLQFASTHSNVSNTESVNDTELEDDTLNRETDLLNVQSHPSPPVGSTEKRPSSAMAPPADIHLHKKKRLDKSQSSQQSTSVEKILNYLENRTSDKKISCEIDLLFAGYAQTVKKISARRQTAVKFKIAKMLMEEELQQQIEDEVAIVSRPTSELTVSTLTSTSSTIESPILSPQSYTNLGDGDGLNNSEDFTEEITAESASRWYEGFRANMM